jgi:LysM repeat protein
MASRCLLYLLCGLVCPLLLTQCKMTSGASYKDVRYDSAKLKTPAGHGMERKDYPFDESGAYRKDWVKANARGKDGSATGSSEPMLASASTPAESAAPAGPATYPTYAEASAARASGMTSTLTSAATTVTPGLETAAVDLATGGETVLLAQAGTSAADAGAAVPATARYHKVGSGDTLFALASRYETSVADLKRINGLSGDSIRVGQSLRLP